VWFAGGGIVGMLLLWVGLAARRSKAMRRVADECGMRYLGDSSGVSYRDFVGIPFFSGFTTEGRFAHVLRGSHRGHTALLFDYQHRMGADGTTVAALWLPRHAVPGFAVRDRSALEDPDARLPVGQLKFDDSPGFNGRFLVFGSDSRAIRQMLDRQVRNFLMGMERDLCVECAGDLLVVYHMGKSLPESELSTFLRRAQRIKMVLIERAMHREYDQSSRQAS
jgi:hypothetical protein